MSVRRAVRVRTVFRLFAGFLAPADLLTTHGSAFEGGIEGLGEFVLLQADVLGLELFSLRGNV